MLQNKQFNFKKRWTLVCLAGIALIGLTVFAWLNHGLRLPWQTPANQFELTLSWNDLLITPRPDGQLCYDSSVWGPEASWEEIKAHPPFMSGMGGSITAKDIAGAKGIGYNTYSVSPNIPIQGTFHLYYPRSKSNVDPVKLRYLVLLDEKQLVGTINQSTGGYYDFTMQPGDEAHLTINIPPLSEGIHDLIILGLVNPDDEPVPEGVIRLLDTRLTLVVSSQELKFDVKKYVELPAEGLLSRGDPMIGSVSLSLKETSIVVWNWPESREPVVLDQPIKFYILAGYNYVTNENAQNLQSPKTIPFALLAFWDYQQVEIAPDATALYGSVSDDTAYARIMVEMQPAKTLGRHDILILRINYPGIPMCILQGPPDGRFFLHNIDGSRVAVDAISK